MATLISRDRPLPATVSGPLLRSTTAAGVAKNGSKGKAAHVVHLPEGTTDFVNGLIEVGNEGQAVADAAHAAAGGECTTAARDIQALGSGSG